MSETRPKLNPKNMTSRERAAYLKAFLEQNRGRAQIKPARHASRPASKIMRPLSQKFGAGTAGLSANWSQIIGPRFSRLSKPVKFMGGRSGTTLLISARGPAATLLSANSRNILDKINSYLAANSKTGQHVHRLKITQGEIAPQTLLAPSSPPKHIPKTQTKRGLTPSETHALQSGLEHIDNDRLKRALEKLGRGAISRQK